MDCDILPMFAIHIPQLCLAHIRSFFGLQPDVCGWKQLLFCGHTTYYLFWLQHHFRPFHPFVSFEQETRWRWQFFSHSFWRTFVVLGFLLEHVAIDTTICHFHRANQDKTTMFWLLLSSLGMIIIDPTIFWMKTLPSMNLPRHCRNFPILSSFHACWLRMFPHMFFAAQIPSFYPKLFILWVGSP